MHSTLISPEILADHLGNPNWRVFDCRFSLKDKEKGRKDYLEAHIPGSAYLHLDEDLSGAIIPGKTGRHPLPDVETLAAKFSQWGIDRSVQVVAYDDMGGAIAARLWWMLQWMGHPAAAVLDGGWKIWQEKKLPVSEKLPSIKPAKFQKNVRDDMLVTIADVEKVYGDPTVKLLDARAPKRYRGEVEPIDPVAGHIPGAISLPFAENLDNSGKMKAREVLHQKFRSLIGQKPSEKMIFYCGSGVTACHNLLAWRYAGLGDGKLFAGSWSEWIMDASRPVETSENISKTKA